MFLYALLFINLFFFSNEKDLILSHLVLVTEMIRMLQILTMVKVQCEWLFHCYKYHHVFGSFLMLNGKVYIYLGEL